MRTLGSRLRGLRIRNEWTLREMSDRTDIPLSTLAKVEADRLTLSYEKLLQVSEKLRIPIQELFLDPESANGARLEVTARRSVGRLANALHVNAKNYDHYYMCPELRNKRMVPVITRIRARSLEEHGGLQQQPGEKYVYVLDGRVSIHTEFYMPIALEPHESIYIDGNMGHACLAEDCEEATALVMCSSPDDGGLKLAAASSARRRES